jgi:hypothetical protein
MELWQHKPWTCVGVGVLSSDARSGETSVELTGTGDRLSAECLMLRNEPSADRAYCSTSELIDPFGGSRISAWIKSPSTTATCWMEHDWGTTRDFSIPQNRWTEISELVAVRAATTDRIFIKCHLEAGATFYVDDFSVTQP